MSVKKGKGTVSRKKAALAKKVAKKAGARRAAKKAGPGTGGG